MPSLWLDGAERRQVHSGGRMVGGPPRVTWHITWDALNRDGSPAISFSGVTDYLNNAGYQPTLTWDPVTGEIIHLLPANVGAAALEHRYAAPESNNCGDVNIQIETYFSPGVVRNGVRYASLLDTPLKGLDRILAWADSWGIPRDAPLAPGDRDTWTWINVAGHYGHFNVPANDHSDPITPIADLLAAAEQPASTPEENPVSHVVIRPGERLLIPVPVVDGGADVVWAQVSVAAPAPGAIVGLAQAWTDESRSRQLDVPSASFAGLRSFDLKPGEQAVEVWNRSPETVITVEVESGTTLPGKPLRSFTI